MNQVVGEGIHVVMELPTVLRDFAAACRREKVGNDLHLHDFATRYFAALANCDVGGRSKAQERGMVPDDYDPMNQKRRQEEREATSPPVVHMQQRDASPVDDTPPPEEYTQADNDAALKIQSLQKGRVARKAVADHAAHGGCIEAKARVMPAPARIAPEGAAHEFSIFDSVDADTGRPAVTFAARHVATGAVHAVTVGDSLKFRIPPSCTYVSFWRLLASAAPEAYVFEEGTPQSTLTVTLEGQRTMERFVLGLDAQGDSNVAASYFEEPFN